MTSITMHCGVGIRPQHTVKLRYESGEVIVEQIVYDNDGAYQQKRSLGKMTPDQFDQLVSTTPEWVWSMGLFSNGTERWWDLAADFIRSGNWLPIWENVLPGKIVGEPTESKKIIVSQWYGKNDKYPTFGDFSCNTLSVAQKAKTVMCPQRWPSAINESVMWRLR